MARALEKPSHVFGRDREWKALADFAADPRPEATLGIVSGRRRQGKTYLLRSLAAATGGFFFEAAEATEAESLRMFGAALGRAGPLGGGFLVPRLGGRAEVLSRPGRSKPGSADHRRVSVPGEGQSRAALAAAA